MRCGGGCVATLYFDLPMPGEIMTSSNSRFTFAEALMAIVFVLWSLVAPRAAAFPDRPDHYKVTLFGVRNVSDMSAESTQTSCGWGAAEAPCRPAPSGGSASCGGRLRIERSARGCVLFGGGCRAFAPCSASDVILTE
jgi:hypothetical protein